MKENTSFLFDVVVVAGAVLSVHETPFHDTTYDPEPVLMIRVKLLPSAAVGI
jgi:hypothetical protein